MEFAGSRWLVSDMDDIIPLEDCFTDEEKRDPRFPLAIEYYTLRRKNDHEAIKAFFIRNPDFAKNPLSMEPLLNEYSADGDSGIVICLLDVGVPVNTPSHKLGAITPLLSAIHNDRYE